MRLETNLKRRNMWKHSRGFDVQQWHNRCFYPETTQFDMWPKDTNVAGDSWFLKTRKSSFLFLRNSVSKKSFREKMYIWSITYISGIDKSWSRKSQFWLGETLVILKSLVQLLCKCFICWPEKHTAEPK